MSELFHEFLSTNFTDLDIYPGDDGATTIFILPKKDISPNEVCEI